MPRLTSTCVFCGRRDLRGLAMCEGCGGPLAAPVGADPGPPPLPAPRPIAREYVWREAMRFPVIWGLAFGGVPILLGVPGVAIGWRNGEPIMMWVSLGLVAVFGGVGMAVMFAGIQMGMRKLGLLRRGVPAVAEVLTVTSYPGEIVNNMQPWSVQYLYDVGGERLGGTALFYTPKAGLFAASDRLHVLYDRDAPGTSVPWPPPS